MLRTGHFATFRGDVHIERIMRNNALLFMFFLWLGCQGGAQEAPRGSSPGPSATPPPRPSRPAQEPAARAPSEAVPSQACRDPQVEKAFEALASCDYKDGVIDFQCPAWKQLTQVLGERELESQALVQLTLLSLLDHGEERVRLAVAKSLASYSRQKSVIRRLGEVFGREPSAEVRAWIIFSLHGSSSEAKTLVLGALVKDPSPLVRAKAAQRLNLAHFGADKEVREALLGALRKDRSEEVRKRAAESLGQATGDAETEKVLMGCLTDPVLGPHCGIGLARLGTASGYAAILEQVKKGLADRSVHPLHLLSLADMAGKPFFSAAVVRPLFGSVARDPRMALGLRHYATRALSRLAREGAAERAAVLVILQGLAKDPTLGPYVRSEIEQLGAAGQGPGRGPR